MKNNIIITAVVALVVGVIGFFGGIQYSKASTPKIALGSGRGLSGGQFSGGLRNGQAGQNGGGFSSGQILSKDASSITVKLRNGGSQIIFFSGSTQIMKSVVGSADDLVVGEEVTATGSTNSDKSITAQSIQIRPALSEGQQPQANRSTTTQSN